MATTPIHICDDSQPRLRTVRTIKCESVKVAREVARELSKSLPAEQFARVETPTTVYDYARGVEV